MDEELEQAADERGDGESHETALAEMRMPPIRLRLEPVAERDAADDRAEIEKARSHRGHAENVFRVQHSHDERGERDEQDERKHDPRELNRERGLLGRKSGRENLNEHRRADDPEHRERAHENNGERGDLAGESPGGGVAVGGDATREGRDESGRKRAFGEEIAQHVGRAERGQKRVHVARSAEERREDDFAEQTQNAAAQNGDADDAGRARADAFVWTRGRCHGRNTTAEWQLTKAKSM